MIDSTELNGVAVKPLRTRFKLASLAKLSLSIALATYGLTAFVPAIAIETGKTTQFFRAQALQNIAAGRDEEALESYKAAIEAARSQYGQESTYISELYFEMGNLARSNGQSEIAKGCYKSAVKYRKNDIPTRLELADLERNTKNIREAFEDSKSAFQLNQSSPIARKGLMLCLQQCGRPAEAAQIAATLHRAGKVSKLPTNMPKVSTDAAPSLSATTSSISPSPSTNPAGNGPIVTPAAGVSNTSALHWAPDLKKKIDEAAAKKAKEAEAAEKKQEATVAAKKKQEEAHKSESDKRTKEQHRKEEAERKSKEKAKKDENQKKKDDAARKASNKTKPAVVEPEANTASLKTSAKTISATGSDDKSAVKSDKSAKADKPATKGHLGVGAITEKTEKPAEEKHESSVSENEPAKTPQAEKAPVMSYPTQQTRVPVPVVDRKPKPHLGKGGLVPPPPATPFFPSYPPPPGLIPTPAPAAPAHPNKPRPPKPVVKESPKETSTDEGSPSPKSGGSDDPDFLIDWGGGAKKKHGK